MTNEYGLDLSGRWHSQYEYTRGSSEHLVDLSQYGPNVVITSVPDQTGSVINLTLELNGKRLIGRWEEQTSLTGHYKGRIFRGAIDLLINEALDEMRGVWTGADSNDQNINTGKWVFSRHLE